MGNFDLTMTRADFPMPGELPRRDQDRYAGATLETASSILQYPLVASVGLERHIGVGDRDDRRALR